MTAADSFLAATSSWESFFKKASTLPASASRRSPDKGKVFERLTQLYLKTHPEYQTKLRSVWRAKDELPPHIRSRIGLPRTDEGIDLVAETFNGELWAIQCKFRTDTRQPLTVADLATFTNLAFNVCKGISLALVAHTCSKPVRKAKLLGKTTEIGLERWLELSNEDWQRVRAATTKSPPPLHRRKPRPHQEKAIAAAKTHFIKGKATRGRMLMPCGTGKSLTAFWIAEALKARSVLVAVPSLALIKQSLTDWTREFLAHGEVPDWLCVCSDESTGRLEQDEFVGGVYELGVDATTDSKEIAKFLGHKSRKRKVIFATYQSGKPLSVAAKATGFKFDLGIMDEAHRTVGSPDKSFGHLLLDKNIPISKRLFMTATERVVRGADDDVLSMDDPKVYGECFHQLSFREAIKAQPPIISDYKILTITVSDERVKKLIEENRYLRTVDTDLGEREAQALAAGIALQRAFKEEAVRHAISFHRSIRAAEEFREQQERIEKGKQRSNRPACYHISSKKTAGERADLLREFRESASALITNARCLQEGVDIPAVDCVLFADPKQSVVDIVQAAGRAMRPHKDKRYGYIVVPIIVPSGMEFSDFAETTEFKQVARVVTALSTQDDRIAEEFRGIKAKNRRGGERIVEIRGDVPMAMRVELDEFRDQVRLKLWERVGRTNWRRFEEAREYARGLKLRSWTQWIALCRSHQLPSDIPANPNVTYRDRGWASYGDWLGTGTIANRDKIFRPYTEARAFARGLGLEKQVQWQEYCCGRLKLSASLPPDIPKAPSQVYAATGWRSWADWLGTQRLRGGFRDFHKAREFVRRLKLEKLGDWQRYCRGLLPSRPEKPVDIPRTPYLVYQRDWTSWSDWLGIDEVPQWRSYSGAREFVRGLKLANCKAWQKYVAGDIAGKPTLPRDIPKAPDQVYAGKGWTRLGWGDFLGSGTVRSGAVKFREFRAARAFARSLGLRSLEDWKRFSKGQVPGKPKFPSDIPKAPHARYKNHGWRSWPDWLGTERTWMPFLRARSFARSLGLANGREWHDYTSGHLRGQMAVPNGIPLSPQTVYATSGWKGWADFLGTSRNPPGKTEDFLSFTDARRVVRKLGLKSAKEWRTWSAGRLNQKGSRPAEIPSNPASHYSNCGWAGWRDWLGTK